jgi:flavin reductase (DIM6/NTAB) family NADH-FMN oxidoreductase RutF
MIEKDLAQAPLQLPCSVVIVSASAGGKEGAMTATAMYVSMKPPRLIVSVSKTFATYQLIEQSRQFGINVIADNQVELSRQFGSSHGFELEKLKQSNIKTEPSSKISAPLIAGCYSNIECQVITSLWELDGNHAVYIAEPVSFKFNNGLRPMVWLSGKYYSVGQECKV